MRTSHSGKNNLFSSLLSLSFLDHHHPLQPWVGFGFLHNSPRACSVLYSSFQTMTPNTTKFIITLSSHPVRGRSFLLQNTLPFSTLLDVHSSDTPYVLAILSSVLSRTWQRQVLQSVSLIPHYSVFFIHLYPIQVKDFS